MDDQSARELVLLANRIYAVAHSEKTAGCLLFPGKAVDSGKCLVYLTSTVHTVQFYGILHRTKSGTT